MTNSHNADTQGRLMAQPLRIDGDICDKFSLYTTTVAATAASFEFREYVDELGRLKAQRLIKKMRPTTDRTLKQAPPKVPAYTLPRAQN